MNLAISEVEVRKAPVGVGVECKSRCVADSFGRVVADE